jgi:hypothetical protein
MATEYGARGHGIEIHCEAHAGHPVWITTFFVIGHSDRSALCGRLLGERADPIGATPIADCEILIPWQPT